MSDKPDPMDPIQDGWYSLEGRHLRMLRAISSRLYSQRRMDADEMRGMADRIRLTLETAVKEKRDG